MKIADYISSFAAVFPEINIDEKPWHVVKDIPDIITKKISMLSIDDFNINGNVAVHRSAIIEQHVVLKGPIIVMEGCFIGAHAYLRGGVFLASKVSIGPGCEIKSSIVLPGTALAHFNFVGDSIVGSNINMEAGSIIANHNNDKEDKKIFAKVTEEIIQTDVTKFGALIGDDSKIGANAVLSPGTILSRGSIVKRLELVQQVE